MAKRRDRLQQALDDLRALGPDATPETLDALKSALADASCHVVAAAADHAGTNRMHALIPALTAAYTRFAPATIKQDPGCAAKLALVRALAALDALDPEPFLHAVRHVQPEPSFGPPIDTAVPLRSQALMALVGLSHPDFPLLAADMLADPEPRCRSAAAQSLAAWGDAVWGSALLRLRLRAGEDDPDVITDCFEAVLALGGDEAIAYVVSRLSEAVYAPAAALALGSARIESALPHLKHFWSAAPRGDSRRIALVAIGLVRSEAALSLLLEVLDGREGSRRDADDALEALAVFAHDPRAASRIAETAERAGLGDAWRQRTE